MAYSPSSAPTSPLPRQLLRYVSSGLVAALHRPAPTISLPGAPRGVDAAAAASQRLRVIVSRAAPSPKGRPAAPRQGSCGHVHAAPAMATIAARVVTPMRRPTPPGPPAQGSGGKVHAVSPAATATLLMRGPAPPSRPAEGSGGKVHAVSPAATARVLMRGPAPPGSPAEGAGGRGGIINAIPS
ncbi:hypothetical protein BDA96_07G060300 [Sorghum bicolor]|uniref:Uncharacterized protein n=2 Tax=Sorghum bicolor TaxID=4558 RepID=A0A921U9J8_SORBI|nr:uncharacterized protein LOC8069666 [Sorghum bicolor]KAG0522701.1 hypothetical protein BDA96_07G060300 [Sorghum bicolor]KXG24548.1 hypothetical protein SORBI_3007G057700 [Sorghum bicolor]|eukprot:XP_021321124.1 uncharacterized protein LOC8069666 [Sorghum bicolor]